MFCSQKYCKYCVKPVFNKDGAFISGYCKRSRYLYLDSVDSQKHYDIQPLYCSDYTPRQRKIKY